MLHVAVGVIKNARGQVLIALRHDFAHQGGLWEFSGGKIEAGESAEQALARELHEELAIQVIHSTPLITVHHQYPDVAVCLHVFLVDDFLGEPYSVDKQALRWVHPQELKNYHFPAANQPIITAAQLPPYYAILDDSDHLQLETRLHALLKRGIKLIQARLKNLSATDSATFIKQAHSLCQQHGALLLINSAVACSFPADGVHLTSRDLMALSHRPAGIAWLAASCHSLSELKHAEHIGVDFAVLAPVLATKTHPDTPPLGWQTFSAWVAHCNFPVYALGGQSPAHLNTAQQAGGQGIAAIRAFL